MPRLNPPSQTLRAEPGRHPSRRASRPRRWLLPLVGGLAALAATSVPAFADTWQPGPEAAGEASFEGYVDQPARGSPIAANVPFRVSGWIVDRNAQGWSGVDEIHVYAGRAGEGGVFLGRAQVAQPRPDVARVMGNPYWAASGFSLDVPAARLRSAPQTITVYAHTPGKGWWLSEMRLGGAAAPPSPATPALGLASVAGTAEQRQFIDQVGTLARRYRSEIGLPPSLVVAMAINESGWGRSSLSQEAHNYFGIKAHRGAGPAGVYEKETWEVVDGERVTITAQFRAYHSLEESLRDLGTFLHTNSRYNPVWSVAGDPTAAGRALLAAGYATDPAWADKLIRLVDLYQLRQLDRA